MKVEKNTTKKTLLEIYAYILQVLPADELVYDKERSATFARDAVKSSANKPAFTYNANGAVYNMFPVKTINGIHMYTCIATDNKDNIGFIGFDSSRKLRGPICNLYADALNRAENIIHAKKSVQLENSR